MPPTTYLQLLDSSTAARSMLHHVVDDAAEREPVSTRDTFQMGGGRRQQVHVHVRRSRCPLAVQHFRRCVLIRETDGRGSCAGASDAMRHTAEAPVRNERPAVVVEEHVARLQVAVYDAKTMQVHQALIRTSHANCHATAFPTPCEIRTPTAAVPAICHAAQGTLPPRCAGVRGFRATPSCLHRCTRAAGYTCWVGECGVREVTATHPCRRTHERHRRTRLAQA